MPKLQFVDIYYGGKCNLTCHQCDTRSDTFRQGEFDTDLDNIKQSIDLARASFSIRNFSLLGGEPLLNFNKVKQVAEYLRSVDKSAVLTMPTNGTLLSKNINDLADFMRTYRVVILLTNHYAAFDSVESSKIKQARDTLVSLLNLTERPNIDFYTEVINYSSDNSTASSGDRFWGSKDIGVFYHEQREFQQHYKLVNGVPKPHAEGDADSSYKNGCCSPFCTFLYDKKMYKCASLGTLDKFLNHHGLLDDPDWQKYLNYKALDLTNCSKEEIKNFSDTNHCAIEQCDMCSAFGSSYTKTAETTLPKYKKYVPISRVE